MAPAEIILTDEASGASARILAGYGFNCYSFRPVSRGEPVEVLWAEPGFAAGGRRPARSGIPVLFPFPGRIRGGTFELGGQTYRLAHLQSEGQAIHGFVLDRPWRVTARTSGSVTGEFQASVDDPALLAQWPADFRLTLTYALTGNTLRADVRVDNPDRRPLPFGFGTHPYFRLPLGATGSAAGCVVTVPVDEYWELVDLLPTGRRLPAVGPRALAGGKAFGETHLDDVFTGLRFDGGHCTTSIADPANRRTVTQTFGPEFRECVVFNPPHREAIAIEPYTCVPDPFFLGAQGIDTGLRLLDPGGSFTASIEIRLD